MHTNARMRIQQVELLSDNWYILKKTTFAYQRDNGEWQTQDGKTILLLHYAKLALFAPTTKEEEVKVW